MLYLGIDPGASQSSPGALALITKDLEVVSLFDWPKDGLRLVAKQYLDILKKYGKKNIKVAIEKIHSAPGQGISSTCKFCMNYGHWEGMLSISNVDYIPVDPQVWQRKIYRLSPKNKKQAALKKARELFPAADLKFKKYHGRADALLIAYYRMLTL